MTAPRDHVRVNRAKWDVDAAEYKEPGRHNWAQLEPTWGVWGVAESELRLLPEVEDLVEVRPPEGATTRYPLVTLEWSRRWPCEEVWKAQKRK